MSGHRLLVVPNIDDRLLPLPGLHLALEQNVDLAIRPSLHLRDPPPGHGKAEESRATPDVAAFATEVTALC